MSDILRQKNIELKISNKNIYLEAKLNTSDNFIDIIAGSLASGVDIIELSGRNVSSGLFLNSAKIIKNLCNEFDTTFIIADRLDIAFLTQADGIFLANDDMDINSAKEILGNNIIIGTYNSNADYTKISSDNVNLTENNSEYPQFIYGDITPSYCKTLAANGRTKICISEELIQSTIPQNTIIPLKQSLLL